jgi:hypothetical protein
MALAFLTASARPADALGNDSAVLGTTALTVEDVLCLFLYCDRPSRGGCDEWGCGTNSPIFGGAAIQDEGASMSPSLITSMMTIDDVLCLFLYCDRPSHGGCEEFGCGGNSPILDGAVVDAQPARSAAASEGSFHELHLGGLPNAAGFKVTGVRKGGAAYTVAATRSAVVAKPQAGGAAPLEGPALVDLVFELRSATDHVYALRIAATNTTRFWADPLGPVRTYTLTYTAAGSSTPRPLCTTGLNQAILFAGDRYDSVHRTVSTSADATSGWLNIACAGTALAKLYLTRHTDASQIVPTTERERQAMLKMFSADVCGDGTSFTTHGHPLLWADAKGITKFASTPATIEGIWTDQGAVCLDHPRRPELAGAIAARCPRPSCGGAMSPAPRGYVVSANPR